MINENVEISNKITNSFLNSLDKYCLIDSKTVFDPSKMTECDRRCVYRAMGKQSKLDAKDYLINRHIDSVKSKWANLLSINFKILDQKVSLSDCKYNLTGEADFILEIGGKVFVTIIKPVNDRIFEIIKQKGALKKHDIEIMIYCWISEYKNGLIIYENSNTLDFLVFYVTPVIKIINSVKNKCTRLLNLKTRGVLPERSHKVIEKECEICEFKSGCWEKDNA